MAIKPNYDLVTQIMESDTIQIPSLLPKRELAELYLALQSWMAWSKMAWDEDAQLMQHQIDMLKAQAQGEIIALFMSEMDR
jgi:hypothetical protein